jgi:hypothetical protein
MLGSWTPYYDKAQVPRRCQDVTGSKYLLDIGMAYLVHGEPRAMETLKVKIETRLHWPIHMPEHLEEVIIT